MSTNDAQREALTALGSIPRDAGGPVFPTPWAARAFALALALSKRGVFTWPEWSETLGRNAAARVPEDAADPEAYWRTWLAALESILAAKGIAGGGTLEDLRDAWRQAAEATPHGEPIELKRQA